MDLLDQFPPGNSNPQLTPEAAAEAAVKAVLDKQNADKQKAIEDSEIVDPGQRSTEAAAPKKESQQPIEGATAELSDALLERALAVDIGEDEARAMPVASLRKLVTRLERESYEPPVQQTQNPKPPQETEEFELPPIGDETTEWDPKVKSGLDARDREILELKKWKAEQEKREIQRAQQAQQAQIQSFHSAFDQQLKNHPEFHDELGDGTSRPLVGTQQCNKCDRLLSRIWTIMQTDKCSMETAFEEATAGMFRDIAKKKSETKLSADLEAHERRLSKRPGGSRRENDLEPGPERATRAVAEALSRRR